VPEQTIVVGGGGVSSGAGEGEAALSEEEPAENNMEAGARGHCLSLGKGEVPPADPVPCGRKGGIAPNRGEILNGVCSPKMSTTGNMEKEGRGGKERLTTEEISSIRHKSEG